ncbi:MAG: 30S ribosomal protein S17 [Candidatus Kerfeldbacteria bacterium]|nr:30S ribosomal protein S17 [Candidatus Kerfeldbacteria bacterium]
MATTTKHQQRLTGIVVSDRMDRTIVVRVDRLKTHRLYKKKFTVSKKYKVHDPENRFHVNDTVTFQSCRPISKDKRWIVVTS